MVDVFRPIAPALAERQRTFPVGRGTPGFIPGFSSIRPFSSDDTPNDSGRMHLSLKKNIPSR
jgi:hypothetical protein